MDPITLMLLLGGGSALVGGIANGIGAAGAAGAQKDAAQRAMDLQREMWAQQQGHQAPYMQAGQSTLADLLKQMRAGAFDVDPASLANDPGYQFRLAEGQKALERSAAARGSLASGGTLKSLARYSQGVASDELQNAWARKQGGFNRLAHIAGMGQNAANSLGAMGGQYANNMSHLYGAQGNADAAGWMGMANAVSGAAGQMGGLGMGMMMPGMGGALPTQQQQLPTQGGGMMSGAVGGQPYGRYGGR